MLIKMFLTDKKQMSLEEAAAKIYDSPGEEKVLKSKNRRLYDIASVLRTLGLIKKVKDDNNRN